MKTITIPNIQITGEKIASAYSIDTPMGTGIYSGSKDRWKELDLYNTDEGKFVCSQIDRSIRYGEGNRYSYKVCETVDEIKAFFGGGCLAQELFARLCFSL